MNEENKDEGVKEETAVEGEVGSSNATDKEQANDGGDEATSSESQAEEEKTGNDSSTTDVNDTVDQTKSTQGSVPATHAILDYGQNMEVNVNGKHYSGNPLRVPLELVETVKKLLFDAHGVTPNE